MIQSATDPSGDLSTDSQLPVWAQMEKRFEKLMHLADHPQEAISPPDWNATASAPGYIQNRTHWVEMSDDAVIFDGNMVGKESVFMEDDTYMVKLWLYHRNGNLYKCATASKFVDLNTTNKNAKHIMEQRFISYMNNVDVSGLNNNATFPMRKIIKIKSPSQTLYLVDNYVRDNLTGNWTCTSGEFSTSLSETNANMVYRHSGFTNISFIDGRSATFRRPPVLSDAAAYSTLILKP
jgi:prepilin-type processing-associated H-X9-DG protein